MNDRVSEGGFLVTKIHHLGQRIFSQILQEHEIEIGPGQGRVIFTLWKDDGISISEIAARTSLGKSTLTETIDRLEQAGYIERVPSSTDRRVSLIQLTEKTAKLQSRFQHVSDIMSNIFYKSFTIPEIERFEKTLRRILYNLEEYEGRS
jgi:DNA-binding MarR family transcriptional regulator